MTDRELCQAVWVRSGVWPGGRALAVDALVVDQRGLHARMLWTTDRETGRTAEWWPYRLGMLRGRS